MDKKLINNLDDLKSFASEFSKTLSSGDVICLSGDLGAGKTTFIKCVCEALGIKDRVQSPTFNIQLQYKNDEIVVNHFDLYRIEKANELEDIGFFEAVEDKALCFVEWAEKFKDEMPDNALWIKIKIVDNKTRKIITI